MGDLIRNVTLLALLTSPDSQRYQYGGFTTAILYSGVTFAVLKPGVYYDWRTIFTAFKVSVWYFVTFSVVVVAVTMEQLNYSSQGNTKMRFCKKMTSYFRMWLYVLGYVIGQDIPAPRFTVASKITYAIWLYCGFLIGSIYTCSLQALIVSPGTDQVPTTFQQLVSNSNYKWGASNSFRSGLGETLFKSSGNPIMKMIYEKMESDKDEVVCTRRALDSKYYACFNWEILEEFHLRTRFTDKSGNNPFQMASEKTFFIKITCATQKGQLFLSNIDEIISRAFDSGVIQYLFGLDSREYRTNLFNKKSSTDDENNYVSRDLTRNDGPKSFGMNAVKGCFFLLTTGFIASLLGFLVEKCYMNMKPFLNNN